MAANSSYGIHLVAGGVGGTVGAVLTCPLEVVKTRLQSSTATFHHLYGPSKPHNFTLPQLATPVYNVSNIPVHLHSSAASTCSTGDNALEIARRQSIGLFRCLRCIIETEGVGALFKGLGPNLVGVAPSRAIYFFCYANSKQILNGMWTPDTALVHIGSAVTAGVTACTVTNPIWLIKTRLQLDQKKDGRLTCTDCIRQIYRDHGMKGFYKGITASYLGVTETVIHFVIYEAIKAQLLTYSNHDRMDNERSVSDFLRFMVAGATSKTIATCIAYPHEVARTRLREEGTRYTGLLQTLLLVWREEGRKGLYRGLTTQLIRQIPNTASMMATYELVVYLFSHYQLERT